MQRFKIRSAVHSGQSEKTNEQMKLTFKTTEGLVEKGVNLEFRLYSKWEPKTECIRIALAILFLCNIIVNQIRRDSRKDVTIFFYHVSPGEVESLHRQCKNCIFGVQFRSLLSQKTYRNEILFRCGMLMYDVVLSKQIPRLPWILQKVGLKKTQRTWVQKGCGHIKLTEIQFLFEMRTS